MRKRTAVSVIRSCKRDADDDDSSTSTHDLHSSSAHTTNHQQQQHITTTDQIITQRTHNTQTDSSAFPSTSCPIDHRYQQQHLESRRPSFHAAPACSRGDEDRHGSSNDSLSPTDRRRLLESEIMALQARAAEQAEQFVRRIYQAGWRVMAHHHLPHWLQDNDFLLKGHRPQLNSFYACFKSIFRIHTETGNIWTHLLGCIAFIVVAVYFLTRPSIQIQLQEKFVFSAFFAGAILCLGFSFLFHTVSCHSQRVGRIFSKLDYCGISLMILGSFIPWLYYSFYCHTIPKIAYLTLIGALGFAAVTVSLLDFFATPRFRGLRAGVFIAFGCSGVIPAIHYLVSDGTYSSHALSSFGWLCLMAVLYIGGALLYAMRIPERWFPGKFDIWFQSHQIFHVLVVAAAFVHYHGVSKLAAHRLTIGDCLAA